MKIYELAFLVRSFLKSTLYFSRLAVECLICLLDLIQPSCHMWLTSEYNTAVGDWKLYRAYSVWTAMAILGFILFLMIPMCIETKWFDPSQSFCLFFRFTQIVMTLTSCGQDLTSSLTYYAAFKTSRRSTTFPGITEHSNVWVYWNCFLCYKYHHWAILSPSIQAVCVLASTAKRM